MTYSTWIQTDFELHCGIRLPQITLAYATYGQLSPQRDNLILYPTSYRAQHSDLDWLIRPDGILNPERWFIVIPNMLGNGLSTSPSNEVACGLREDGFWFSHWDNVRLQETHQAEAEWIPNALYRGIPSIWGHRAGNPYQNPVDEAFIQEAIQDLMQSW
ncbi:MAG: hypothetical protein SNJ85_13955 [Cyanobacteriota bacterium]